MDFFEQIGIHITGAGQKIAQQTGNFANITQLQKEIKEKEKRISLLITDVGNSYYEKHKDDASAEELQKINEINMLQKEIEENYKRINQIKEKEK